MAKGIVSEKGFKVITLTPEEAKTIGFGIEEGCLCMHCNKIIKGTIYYIAILNDVMDEECFNEWLKYAIHYSEDAPIEDYNYVFYVNHCLSHNVKVETK